MAPATPQAPASLPPRALARLAAMALASALLMPAQWLLLRIARGRAASVLPRWWFACLRRALGIRARVVGTPRTGGGTLFVGNHVSHYDIVLLGSLLRARFIAKDDMEAWPGMAAVGALGRTLFISRRSRDAAAVAAAIAARLRSGDDVVLFAEGTTSDGTTVLPFKSSLFALFLGVQAPGGRAEHESGATPWTLQPFTLDLEAVDGRRLANGGQRDAYAFHGDMDAGAHVRRFLALSGAQVRVVFHAPLALAAGSDRKALAARVQAIVATGLRGGAPAG